MDQTPLTNLHFGGRSQAVPRRLILIGVAMAVFTALWVLVPPSALYWLLLPLVALLAWVGSYGWRLALSAIHELLHHLTNF